jgi:peptide/nickel transport system permease protein
MSLLRPILFRAAALAGVLLAVLVLLVVSLGATGVSDKLLNAIVGEDIRGMRFALSQTIRDPVELESALAARRQELESL